MKSNNIFIKQKENSSMAILVQLCCTIPLFGLLISFSSCKKSGFLDQKILSQIDEKAIFTDSLNTSYYVNSRYNNVDYSYELNRWGQGGVESACDEAQPPVQAAQLTQLQTYWETGAINSSNISSDGIWGTTYAQVRAVNIFLRDEATIPVSKATKTLYEGEMRFLRAWYLATLLKTYGGFPIVGNAVFKVGDNINIPRSSYSASVKYVVGQCDSAAAMLPADFVAQTGNPADYGRATKGAALALKARVLLYAASPLTNQARGDDPDHLVSYGNADPGRWQLAADAAQAVINLGVYSLYRAATPAFYNQFLNGLNYTAPNSEAIFSFMPATSTQNNMFRETICNPPSRATRYQTGSNTACYPLQEMVDAFGMQNGKAISDPSSGYPGIGDQMYLNRDPRFYYTITYNGFLRFLAGHSTDQPVWTYTGVVPSSTNVAISGALTDGIYTATGTKTGYYCYKMLCDNVAPGGIELNRSRILIRYAEILLDAAEANNEVGGPSPQIYTWLKDIRNRAGISPGADGMYGMNPNMSQAEMRTFLQNERQVELAFEEQRFWDVRRWMIAPAVLNKEMHGMEITRAANGSFSYRTIVVRSNVFRTNMYWFPIAQSELVKSSALKQNPGY
jgi:hypothetical protein